MNGRLAGFSQGFSRVATATATLIPRHFTIILVNFIFCSNEIVSSFSLFSRLFLIEFSTRFLNHVFIILQQQVRKKARKRARKSRRKLRPRLKQNHKRKQPRKQLSRMFKPTVKRPNKRLTQKQAQKSKRKPCPQPKPQPVQ